MTSTEERSWDFPGQKYEYRSNDNGQINELDKVIAPRTLWLKRDCPVVLIRNLSSVLVNGLCGTVKKLPEINQFKYNLMKENVEYAQS